MHKALDQLSITPNFIAVDGNRFKAYKNIPHATQVKGDARFLNIAAASILAKTYRDDFMEKLHLKFPEYAWNSNMGYPTTAHRDAIREFGITPHHRKTFQLLPSQTKIEF
jgi:ribonuclease HII